MCVHALYVALMERFVIVIISWPLPVLNSEFKIQNSKLKSDWLGKHHWCGTQHVNINYCHLRMFWGVCYLGSRFYQR